MNKESFMQVSIGLINYGDHLVFQKRRKPPYRHYFGLIGGKIENGDGPDQTLIREIKEESGLNVDEMSYRGDIYEVLIKNDGILGVQLSVYSAMASGRITARKTEGEIHLVYPNKLDELKDEFIPTDWMITNQLIRNKDRAFKGNIVYVVEKKGKYEFILNDH